MTARSASGARASRRRLLAAVAAAYATALAVALAVGWALRGAHPVLVAAAADLAATLVVFAASVAADNSSLYDPYWSVAPIPIVAWWAAAPGSEGRGLRVAVALALVAAWGVRLTVNCLARWRSLADEDFRYLEIRGRTGRLYWPASLLAVHLLPTAWVFLGLLPLVPALTRPGRPPGLLDLLGAVVTGVGIALEAAADQQLRAFIRRRAHPQEALDTGLWAACRHPNYLGEVLFWWGLWLLGVAAEPAWAWSAVGPLAITLLFVFVSVPWMDRRMATRHPAWAAHLRDRPALIPRIFR